MKLDAFIDQLFEEAGKSPFTDFEIYYSGGESFKAKVFKGQLEEYSANKSYGISFRGLYNGKIGYSYTEAFDDGAIKMLIKKAMENAQIIENEDEQFIFEGSDSYQDITLFNEELQEVTAREKIDTALKLEETAKGLHPAITDIAATAVQSGSGETRIKNSKGLNLVFRDNILFCYVAPIAQQGERKVDGFEYQIVRDFSNLDIEYVAKKAVENAVSMLNAASIESGEYKVIFENECAGDLISTFEDIFSAESTQKDLSLLKGKVGHKIASDKVNIIDDPLMDGGYATCPFDSEGVATYKKSIVKDGVLMTLLHNLKTAKKEGVTSTGNASKGSYKGSIGISGTNFYLSPGEKSFEELCKSVGDGLIITQLEGINSGANEITGDFSLSAKGFRLESGKKTQAVEQITIAGNFYKLLKEIEQVGNDLRFGLPVSACIGSPSFVVKSLEVTG